MSNIDDEMEEPVDEELIRQIDSWKITLSPIKKRIYIDTISYHPVKLALTKKDLLELIEQIDKA
ncbi:MAG: hypothetical protein ISR96_06815 [Nitrospira sp.]|nr:hypothetical protein [bacterium]MBL7049207.1 hypothetical protein [Nitrospira sp.]